MICKKTLTQDIKIKEVLTEEEIEYIFTSIEDESLKDFINTLLLAKAEEKIIKK